MFLSWATWFGICVQHMELNHWHFASHRGGYSDTATTSQQIIKRWDTAPTMRLINRILPSYAGKSSSFRRTERIDEGDLSGTVLSSSGCGLPVKTQTSVVKLYNIIWAKGKNFTSQSVVPLKAILYKTSNDGVAFSCVLVSAETTNVQ